MPDYRNTAREILRNTLTDLGLSTERIDEISDGRLDELAEAMARALISEENTDAILDHIEESLPWYIPGAWVRGRLDARLPGVILNPVLAKIRG